MFENNPTVKALMSCMNARVPVMLVGAPGVGKTATMRALADHLGYELITLIGSQMDPTDLVGLPSAGTMGDLAVTNYLAPWWQAKTLSHKKVILFFDEFSTAPPAVQAAMLTPLQEREFANGVKFPDETIVVGAMNPSEIAANGQDLSLPTTNRIVFLPWDNHSVGLDSWFEGMLTAWGKRKLSDNEKHWRKTIVDFLKDNPGFIHNEPDLEQSSNVYGVSDSDNVRNEIFRMAWSSMRSWDNLATVLGQTEFGDQYAQNLVMQGTVGYSSAKELCDWIIQNHTIDFKQVLSAPENFDWDNESRNTIAIVLRSIVDNISPTSVAKTLNLVAYLIKTDRAGLLGAYYQTIFDKATDVNLVGKANAVKAGEIVGQMIPKLMKYVKTTE